VRMMPSSSQCPKTPERPEQDTDTDGEHYRGERHDEVQAGRHHHPREHVLPVLVGPETGAPARRRAPSRVDVVGIVGRHGGPRTAASTISPHDAQPGEVAGLPRQLIDESLSRPLTGAPAMTISPGLGSDRDSAMNPHEVTGSCHWIRRLMIRTRDPAGEIGHRRRPVSGRLSDLVYQPAGQSGHLAGLGIVGLIVLAAVLGHSCAYDPYTSTSARRLLRLRLAHPFGTDQYGQDVPTRVMVAARLDLVMAPLRGMLSVQCRCPARALSGSSDTGWTRHHAHPGRAPGLSPLRVAMPWPGRWARHIT